MLPAYLAISVLITGFISGVFGMAGGMILMGAFLLVLPVPVAMVLHAVTQMTSNGWRGVVWRRYADFRVFGRFLIGLLAASGLFFFVSYVPDRATVFICLGSIPFLVILVPKRLIPQADKPFGAEICGFLNALLQFVAGVSGPILDAFFIRAELDRRTVVATKAVCQTTAHLAKLIYFMQASDALTETVVEPWVVLLCILMAVLGTTLSRSVLEKLSDAQFRRWTQSIIMLIGGLYLAQGVYLYTG